MVQTYQGYFQDGRFVSPQTNSIPEFVEVYIVVTNKSVMEKNKAQKQRQAFETFNEAIANAKPLDKDFDEIIKS